MLSFLVANISDGASVLIFSSFIFFCRSFCLEPFLSPFGVKWPHKFCSCKTLSPLGTSIPDPFPAEIYINMSFILLVLPKLCFRYVPALFTQEQKSKVHLHSRKKYLTCCTLDYLQLSPWLGSPTPQTSWVTCNPCRSVVMTTIFCFIQGFLL